MKNSSRFAFDSFVLSGLLGLALLLTAGSASATPMRFNVSGSATNVSNGTLGSCSSVASPCPFSGTLLIDTTNGTLDGMDISFPGLTAFNESFGSSDSGQGLFVFGYNSEQDGLDLIFSGVHTLVGFTGANFLVDDNNFVASPAGVNVLYRGFSGSVTPQSVAAVPEPSSLGMMLLGLVLLGPLVFFAKRSRARSRQPRATGARPT